MNSYKDLVAYQKAYELSLHIYRVTRTYPKGEIYGPVSQMRRSAVSIPCNIAEGYRRGHRKEYIRFLNTVVRFSGLPHRRDAENAEVAQRVERIQGYGYP